MDTCKVCSNQFARKYRCKGERKIYCSKSCRYKDSYVIKICKNCKLEFTTNVLSRNAHTEYCSLSCIERNPCLLCGKIITGRKTWQGKEKRFCSTACASRFNSSINGEKNYTVRGFASTIKRTGKLACEDCGFDNVKT